MISECPSSRRKPHLWPLPEKRHYNEDCRSLLATHWLVFQKKNKFGLACSFFLTGSGVKAFHSLEGCKRITYWALATQTVYKNIFSRTQVHRFIIRQFGHQQDIVYSYSIPPPARHRAKITIVEFRFKCLHELHHGLQIQIQVNQSQNSVDDQPLCGTL